MKTATLAMILSVAGIATASPTPLNQAREEQAVDGIFGKGHNIVSDIFDTASCFVTGIIGGGGPSCKGKGKSTVSVDVGTSHGNHKTGKPSKSTKESSAYNYNYDTNKDGTLHIVITLERGGSCTYDVTAKQAKGKELKDVVDEQAQKCLKKKH